MSEKLLYEALLRETYEEVNDKDIARLRESMSGVPIEKDIERITLPREELQKLIAVAIEMVDKTKNTPEMHAHTTPLARAAEINGMLTMIEFFSKISDRMPLFEHYILEAMSRGE